MALGAEVVGGVVVGLVVGFEVVAGLQGGCLRSALNRFQVVQVELGVFLGELGLPVILLAGVCVAREQRRRFRVASLREICKHLISV